MANEFNPTAQPTQFSASISPLKLQGKSMAFAAPLAEGVKAGVEFVQEKNKQDVFSRLDERLNALNQEYFDRNPEMLAAQQGEIANEYNATAMEQYAMTQNPTFTTGEQIDAQYAYLDSKQQELKSRLDKLQVARNQGALSSFEYAMRAKRITRELVAENPHLTRELIGRLSQNLGLSGMEERIKYDEKMREDQAASIAKRNQDIDNEADKRNIPRIFDETGAVDYDAMAVAIDRHRANKGAFELLQMNSQSNEILDKQVVRGLINKGVHYGAVNGAFDTVEAQLVSLYNDNTVPYANKPKLAEAIISKSQSQMRTFLSPYMGESEIKDAVTFFDGRLESLRKALDSFASGDDAKKYFSNTRTIMDDKENIDLMKKFNVTQYKFITGIVRDLGPASLLQYNPQFYKNTVSLASSIISNSIPSPNNYNKDESLNLSNFGALFKNHFTEINKGNTEHVADFNKTVANFYAGINSPEVTKNPDEFFKRSEEFLAMVRDPMNAKGIAQLDANSKSLILENLDNYNRVLANGFATAIRTNPDANIQMTVAGDGSLLVRGGSQDFNTRIVNRINAGLEAYAAINGMSKVEASKEFYRTYYNDAFTKPDAPNKDLVEKNNPAGIVAADGKTLRQFASTEEGVRFSINYVGDLYNKQNKRTLKAIVETLFPKETLGPGATQTELVNSLSKSTGFGPTEKLELSDKVNLSKLMSGIYAMNGMDISFQKVYDMGWPNEAKKIKDKKMSKDEMLRSTADAWEKIRSDKKLTKEQKGEEASRLMSQLRKGIADLEGSDVTQSDINTMVNMGQ